MRQASSVAAANLTAYQTPPRVVIHVVVGHNSLRPPTLYDEFGEGVGLSYQTAAVATETIRAARLVLQVGEAWVARIETLLRDKRLPTIVGSPPTHP